MLRSPNASLLFALVLFCVGDAVTRHHPKKPTKAKKVQEVQAVKVDGDVVTEQQDDIGPIYPEDEVGPGPSCAIVNNHVSHITVEVGVGSPQQMFNMIPDTGSSTVVVNSCVCETTDNCKPAAKCFWGKQSSSFRVRLSERGGAQQVQLAYDGGMVTALPSSDKVHLGNLTADLNGGLLLMTGEHLPATHYGLEGILGLGLPKSSKSVANNLREFSQLLLDPAKVDDPIQPVALSFLAATGVQRFSLCMNDGTPGVMRMQSVQSSDSLGSMGTQHWGLGLEGVSVGDMSAMHMSFCNKEFMRYDQKTPCGAIPDSGTSLILGPKAHLSELFLGICNGWSRCRKVAAEEKKPRAEVFESLLANCHEWILEGDGLDELPPIHFQLMGSGGTGRKVTVHPTTYIFQTEKNTTEEVLKYIDVFPVKMREETATQEKVCRAAFGEVEYPTDTNGLVWVLGLPFFYEYRVGFDKNPDPPVMSFNDQPCGKCQRDGAELDVSLTRQVNDIHGNENDHAHIRRAAARFRRHSPRFVDSLRLPPLDVTLPF